MAARPPAPGMPAPGRVIGPAAGAIAEPPYRLSMVATVHTVGATRTASTAVANPARARRADILFGQRKEPLLPAAAPVDAPQHHETATGERGERRCHGDHVEGMRDTTGRECDRVDNKPQRPHQESSADQVGTRRAAAAPHPNDETDQRQRIQPPDLRRHRIPDHECPCAMGVRPSEANRRIAAYAVAAEQVVLEHHREW